MQQIDVKTEPMSAGGTPLADDFTTATIFYLISMAFSSFQSIFGKVVYEL